MRGNFENTGRLVRFILRRERLMSSLWVIGLTLFSVLIAPAIGGMFDAVSLAAFAETMNNPAMIAMMGPVYGYGHYTVGAMYSNAMLLWVLITAAVMNIFLVVRHTRGDEEKGRAEVIRSLPTGRLANLNATLLIAAAVNGLTALLTGLLIAALRIESMDLGGSMLYGAAVGAGGLFFAAVAALFSQLSASSRGAVGYSFATVGIVYLLRAAGDLNNETLSLISPMGLLQRTLIYVGNKGWPVGVVLLETVAVAALALLLNSIRDMDQGLIPAKPGRREASKLLRSPLGLAFRLLRNMAFGWLLGLFALGLSYGSILGDIDSFVNESAFYSMIVGSNDLFTTAQMFVSMVTSIVTLMALAPILLMVLKLRSEEKEGRAEHILSRAVSRSRYLGGYVLPAAVFAALAQCAAAAGIYAAALAVLPNPGDLTLGYLLKAHVVYLPALWFMVGVAVLLIGLAPKAVSLVWGYYGLIFFTLFIGRIPGLMPAWLAKLTPFGYIPQLPMDDISYPALVLLTLAAAGMTALGFVFYRKRDSAA